MLKQRKDRPFLIRLNHRRYPSCAVCGCVVGGVVVFRRGGSFGLLWVLVLLVCDTATSATWLSKRGKPPHPDSCLFGTVPFLFLKVTI